jgi:hypothetical protein
MGVSKDACVRLDRMTTSKHLRGGGITPSSTEFHSAPPVPSTARTTAVAAKVEQLKLRPGEWQVVRIGHGAHLATPFRRRGCEVRTVGRHDGMVDVWACWPTEPLPEPKKRAPRKPKPTAPPASVANADDGTVSAPLLEHVSPEVVWQRQLDRQAKSRAAMKGILDAGIWPEADAWGRDYADRNWQIDPRFVAQRTSEAPEPEPTPNMIASERPF